MGIEALHCNNLITEDVSMLGKMPVLQNPVTGIVFLGGDEENAALAPSPEEIVIDIPFIDRHDRAGGKGHRLSHLHLVSLAIGDMGKYRQVPVMVQKQMELHRPLGLAELGPVKKAGAKLDHRGIQTEKLVPEPKLPLAEVQLPALAQKLVKYPLVYVAPHNILMERGTFLARCFV